MRQRNSRPVAATPASGPRCVPSSQNSTTTASSAWRREISSLRWSGNAARDSLKYARTACSPSWTAPVAMIS